jgi:hypothetical protein
MIPTQTKTHTDFLGDKPDDFVAWHQAIKPLQTVWVSQITLKYARILVCH